MKKHTTGEVRVDKSIAYTYIRLEDGGFIAMLDNLEGSSTVQKEHEGNAELIEEAFNVANETGKTPRQLADENKEMDERDDLLIESSAELFDLNEKLLEACKALMTSIDSGMDVMKSMDKATAAIHNATK